MLYWLGIWAGALLGVLGGIAGLVVSFESFGWELFTTEHFNQFMTAFWTVAGPVGSILSAAISLMQRLLVDIWMSEVGGLVMFVSGLLMMGFVATSRMTLLPGVVSVAGSMLLLIASDEIKPMPS
jgi:hypothetical protein